MEDSLVKQVLVTNFFAYYPLGGALYDSNGLLIAINKAMCDKFAIKDSSDFFLNNLFENAFLSDAQKQFLRKGSVVNDTVPTGYSIIPGFDETGGIVGYTLLLTTPEGKELDVTRHDQILREQEDVHISSVSEQVEWEKENKILTDKLAESQTMMELALKNSHITTYSFDFCRFISCNKKDCNHCFQFYGANNYLLERNMYICRALTNLRHPDDRTDFFLLFNEIRNKKLPELTVYFRLKNDDGEYRNYEVIGKALEFNSEGLANLIVGCLVDNQKYVEYEQSLIDAKEKAENADLLKSTFLANMTHEIRTPLNAIVGFSDLLSIETDPELRETYISLIKSNNELLLRLINDVLDISKIESGMVTLAYMDIYLPSEMRDMYNVMQMRMPEEVKLILDPCPDITIRTDKSRLMQILSNLLTNAIKHTRQGTIRFGYKLEEELVSFYVSDTGKGIPQKELDHIFGRFVQLKGAKNGIGLGLSISKGLVNMMGGEISVTSKVGEGSTFRFTLPLANVLS